jgi:hypothetical protein
MREINQKVVGEQEKTWEELYTKNRDQFELIKSEEYQANLKRDIKGQALGNKDKTFKLEIAEKWYDDRLN